MLYNYNLRFKMYFRRYMACTILACRKTNQNQIKLSLLLHFKMSLCFVLLVLICKLSSIVLSSQLTNSGNSNYLLSQNQTHDTRIYICYKQANMICLYSVTLIFLIMKACVPFYHFDLYVMPD